MNGPDRCLITPTTYWRSQQKKKMKADLKRCQWETLASTIQYTVINRFRKVRCKNKPAFVATRKKGTKREASMSLCEPCRKLFLKANGKNYAVITPI